MTASRHCPRRRALGAVVALALVALALPGSAGAFVYWANSGPDGIGRANLDGSSPNQNFITETDAPFGIAVDGQHIYWPNREAHAMSRSNLDGTGVLPDFITGAGDPVGVAVDGQHIYWGTGHAIARANLDGTGVERDFITHAGSPVGVAVDGDHVYWANDSSHLWPDGSIGRANLDGSNATQGLITDTIVPTGVAVDAQNVYFSEDISGFGGDIERADLNGSNESWITSAFAPAGVAVDGQHIYWTNRGGTPAGEGIGRANLDGTGVNQTFIPAGDAAGVAVDSLLHPTATTVACAPATVTLPAAASCTATITDTVSVGGSPPSGEVRFSSSGVGAFGPASTCQLQATAASESDCKLDYAPSAAGAQTITAAYSGGASHVQSGGDTALAVLSPPSPKPSNSFVLAKPKLHRRRGTATLIAKLPGAGKLVLEGMRIHHRMKLANSPGQLKLGVKAKGKKRRKLGRSGRAWVTAAVTYTPTGGDPRTKSRKLELRLKRG